ncbi:ubiquitin-like modifier-activating enzyme ATG7 isoform X1 [Gordionus sp. m RMFG-2023]|uniref:ubiquitin-like modifier-activating enzyme ATG7 isoform X1 n=1 Tax=Gordionus sp. m RMFG-2023 TaxID=3053472 RepID=UPI0031FE316C
MTDPCTIPNESHSNENIDKQHKIYYYPGWSMRNLISLIKIRLDNFFKHSENQDTKKYPLNPIDINIVSFKLTPNVYPQPSNQTHSYSLGQASTFFTFKYVFHLSSLILSDELRFVGYETDAKGRLEPRHLDLSPILDPSEISETASKLNIRLMKWRAMPELNLDKVFGTKCLLIGAGTLGCNIARCLLAWGINHITFIDNGTVSYSNPTRQSLYTFDDALSCSGKLMGGDNEAIDRNTGKAIIAARTIKKIFPKASSEGYNMTVPCPGHPLSSTASPMLSSPLNDNENLTEPYDKFKDVKLLETLIQAHDAIFLLTDTRESRWLPSVIGAIMEKIVITAALGLDSYLIMRQGSRTQKISDENVENLTEKFGQINADNYTSDNCPGLSPNTGGSFEPVSGEKLGCYFCNDIIAPNDTTHDRSLDQQCTVTRPGLSFMATGFSVELLLSIIQHSMGINAPAISNANPSLLNSYNTEPNSNIESCLGIVPHQIRGFLSNFSTIHPLTLAFDKCTACSDKVLNIYRSEQKYEFLTKVFDSQSTFLEEFTGLKDLLEEAVNQDITAFSSEDESSMA